MSEFSESYHLATTDVDNAVALLHAAGVAGWVFPPANGWVTIVADAEFGMLEPETLLAATQGLLLHYVCAEDHGWWFVAGTPGGVVYRYAAEWEDEIEVDDDGSDADAFVAALGTAGVVVDGAALAAALEAPTEADLIDPNVNPGHRFAELLGWAEYEWLSGSTARGHEPNVDGATRVEP